MVASLILCVINYCYVNIIICSTVDLNTKAYVELRDYGGFFNSMHLQLTMICCYANIIKCSKINLKTKVYEERKYSGVNYLMCTMLTVLLGL